MWNYRHFWMSLVRLDLKRRYRHSVLGLGWSLLQPIVVMSVLCMVFCNVFQMNVREYAPFVLAGLACWNFLVSVTLQGCQCFIQGEPYIRQHPVPLSIFPLRTTLGVGFHFLIALAIVLAIHWGLNGWVNPSSLLSLVPSIALLMVLGWSLAVLAGLATVYFPDAQHLCEVGFQVLFYATPVMYRPEVLRDSALARFVEYNPVVPFLNVFRDPILYGTLPSTSTCAIACATVVVAVSIALLALIRLQKRLIFHL
jgi:lipopolysaccharide transport system permease protein